MAKKETNQDERERVSALLVAERAAAEGDLEGLAEVCLEFEGRVDFSSALMSSAFYGQAQSALYLISRCDVSMGDYEALRVTVERAGGRGASEKDTLTIIKALIPRASQEAIDRELSHAARNGNRAVALELLESASAQGRGVALARAASRSKSDCVEALAPRMDDPLAAVILEAAIEWAGCSAAESALHC